MTEFGRRWWFGIAVLVGVQYWLIGVVSAALAASAPNHALQFCWRLSAFVVSGLLLVAHVAFEHFRFRSARRAAVGHATIAAAIGGFALALAANVHDLASASGYRPRMLVALIAWPLLTGVPACLVALVVSAVLAARRPQNTEPPTPAA